MSNPFGEAPPAKPSRPAKPPPPNPFLQNKQTSQNLGLGPKTNPFIGPPAIERPSVDPPNVPPMVPTVAPPAVVPGIEPPPLPLELPPPSTPKVELSHGAPPVPQVEPMTPSMPPPPPPPIPSADFDSEVVPKPIAIDQSETNHAEMGNVVATSTFPVPVNTIDRTDDFSNSHMYQDDGFSSDGIVDTTFPVESSITGSWNDVANQEFAPSQVFSESIVKQPPVVEIDSNITILAPPPPQLDDDPYEIHFIKPIVAPVVVPSVQPSRAVKHEEPPPKKKSSTDPFDELVAPLKPKPVTNAPSKPVNPLDSLPLNVLMKQQQKPLELTKPVSSNTAPLPTQSTTQIVSEPIMKPLSTVVHADPSTSAPLSKPVDPFASSHSSGPGPFVLEGSAAKQQVASEDNFDEFEVTSAPASSLITAAPAVPVISAADFDIFASKKPVTSHQTKATPAIPIDPFATTALPLSAPPSSGGATVDDTFDVFGIPAVSTAHAVVRSADTKRPNANKSSAPPQPAISKASTTATKPPAHLETSHPHAHLPVRQAAPPSTPAIAPAASFAAPELIFSPSDYRKTDHGHSEQHHLTDDDDPFGLPAPSASKPLSTFEDDFDDPFGTKQASTAFASDHELDDPLTKLKQSYGLTTDVHSHHDDGFIEDAFGDFDDFSFDQANHGHGVTSASSGHRPTKQSSTASKGYISTPSTGTSTLSMEIDPQDGIQAQGEILSRLSTKAMLTKDWHDSYYVIMRDHLFVFRSKVDYFQYQAQQKNRQRRSSNGDTSAPLFKKCIPLVYNVKLEPIKGKDYKAAGFVYNFSLEQLEDFGAQNLGKFGSLDREAVQALWDKIREIVMDKRKTKLNPRQYG